jgi:hypothetical protein
MRKISNMPLRGLALSCPHMHLGDQHLHAQSCPSWTSTFVPTQVLQANHKQLNLINNKEAFASLIVLLKPQATKYDEKLSKIHNRPSSMQFHSCNIRTHVSFAP